MRKSSKVIRYLMALEEVAIVDGNLLCRSVMMATIRSLLYSSIMVQSLT